MLGANVVGHELIDLYADKLVDRVPEQRSRRRIGENDPAGGIGDDQRIRVGRRTGCERRRSRRRRAAAARDRKEAYRAAARHETLTGATRM